MALGILLYHTAQDKIVSIAITTQPTTRTYEVNSSGNVTFSFAGAVVTATYKSGKTEDITPSVTWSPTTDSITTVATSKTTTVTATFEDFTATTTMTVKNPLTSIAITTQPTTRTYEVNSSGNATFDFTGAVVTATFKNGATKTVTPTWSPTTGSITTATVSSSITVTASYTEASVIKTATTTMTLNNPIQSIAITTQPTTRTYTVNSSGNVTFSFTGAAVTATYKNGATGTVTPTWSPTTSSITDTTETKSVTVTATYSSKTATTTMTVNNPVSSLSVSASSTTYWVDATTSGTVTATLTNGKTKTVTATRNPTTVAISTKSVTFSYGGKSCTQTVTSVYVNMFTYSYFTNVTLAYYRDDGTNAGWVRNSYATSANRSVSGNNGNVSANPRWHKSQTISNVTYTNCPSVHTNHSTIGYNMCYVRSGATIPLGSFKTLTLTISRTGTRVGNTPEVGFSTASTKEYTYVNYPSTLGLTKSTTLGTGNSQTINIDISDTSGSAYFYFCWLCGSNSNGPTDEYFYITAATLKT